MRASPTLSPGIGSNSSLYNCGAPCALKRQCTNLKGYRSGAPLVRHSQFEPAPKDGIYQSEGYRSGAPLVRHSQFEPAPKDGIYQSEGYRSGAPLVRHSQFEPAPKDGIYQSEGYRSGAPLVRHSQFEPLRRVVRHFVVRSGVWLCIAKNCFV